MLRFCTAWLCVLLYNPMQQYYVAILPIVVCRSVTCMCYYVHCQCNGVCSYVWLLLLFRVWLTPFEGDRPVLTLEESARQYQVKHDHRVDLKEVEVITGEEDESNVLQVTDVLVTLKLCN